MTDYDLDYHEFKPFPEGGDSCAICGDYKWSSRHDVDEDDEVLGLAWVMEQQRKRSRISYTCSDCHESWNDEFLAKNHRCYNGIAEEDEFGGHCEDYPACGHEYGDCFGRKYGSDESIKQLHYDLMSSGMEDYEIDAYYERMDGGY